MTRTNTTRLAIVLVLGVTLAAAPAEASVDQDLARARATHGRLLERVERLQDRLEGLLARYTKIEREAGRASIRLVEAAAAAVEAEQALAQAEARFDDRVRTAYQLAPGGFLQALLSAETFADIATIREFTARTLGVDASAIEDLRTARDLVLEREAAAAAAREALEPRQRRLDALLAQMRTRLEEAERLAGRAGVAVEALAEQRRALEDAAARGIGRNLLDVGTTGRDQTALLALLGPTGGRTCETPPGLRNTGKSFEGYASWYGWEFGGQTTANGAIFDPRLFTAANRWLPFGTFLRVRYRHRCAIVLVNDRGPYGHLERVIDLSMASARYLGVGVSFVHADILVPADAIPA